MARILLERALEPSGLVMNGSFELEVQYAAPIIKPRNCPEPSIVKLPLSKAPSDTYWSQNEEYYKIIKNIIRLSLKA